MKKLLEQVWLALTSFGRWLLLAALALGFPVLIVVGSLFFHHKRLEPLLKAFSWAMVWASGMRLKVLGRESIDWSQPYVMTFNHNNILDHFVVYAVVPQVIRGIEKASHFRWPIYGYFLKRIQQVPVDPKAHGARARASLALAKQLVHGHSISIAVAPEGTRSKDGQLLPFKKGAFALAIDLGVPVLPLVFEGMHELLAKGGFCIRPRQVTLTIHPAISTEGMSKQQAQHLCQQVRQLY